MPCQISGTPSKAGTLHRGRKLVTSHTDASQIKSLIKVMQRRAWGFIIVNYIPELNLCYRYRLPKKHECLTGT
jgi:hypothetical protein